VDDEAIAVTLRPGQRTTVRPARSGDGRLPVEPTRWRADTDAVTVSLTTAPRREEINGRPPGARPSTSWPLIEARHRGRATVTLEQRRSWGEQGSTPRPRRVLTVTVA